MDRAKQDSREIDTAFNVLINTLGVEYSDLEPETVANLTKAINRDAKVKNSALLYLTCNSTRADVMRARLIRDVMELYERGY